MYSNWENNMDDAYLGNATAKSAWEKYEIPYYNIQMVRYIEVEKNADRNNLI